MFDLYHVLLTVDHNVSTSLARIVQVPAPTANNSDTCGVFFVIKKYKML